MSLAKGFARDGIGASLLGFEIFVRWTSLAKVRSIRFLVGPDMRISGQNAGSMRAWMGIHNVSGWTRVNKIVQI
ncbi:MULTISPECIES: hypothetical protein [unclassified Mesorhizobium]|uniref:hypothetical protein n=1 Tax=unclassified Mesorhizobium TaxID=325217 RepID=UPI000FD539DD|nr:MULTISPECIES: hypothetical protein [unclassified Mesorhizobium]RUX06204.1 hypothetical protein EOA30_10815 [Mesorhizobium sp. M8A.F.Ca.ET.059.01.1.1]TIS84070.1 MAG: hypothetical protein E5W88_28795 [Mesorhizobium sp.]